MLECDASAPDLDADYPSHASRSSTSSSSNLFMINEHNLPQRVKTQDARAHGLVLFLLGLLTGSDPRL